MTYVPAKSPRVFPGIASSIFATITGSALKSETIDTLNDSWGNPVTAAPVACSRTRAMTTGRNGAVSVPYHWAAAVTR
jgi:hypothetical protein